MGKRSTFPRLNRDTYDTPEAAVLPLLPHLTPGTRFVEPCAGKGDLIRHLTAHGMACDWAGDIAPRAPGIAKRDALATGAVNPRDQGTADLVITNPPWSRGILHPMIERFTAGGPAWLLFDADWMHTQQARPYLPWLCKIVSVGRVKWIPDSPHTGKDNCCWYFFDRNASGCEFWGRV